LLQVHQGVSQEGYEISDLAESCIDPKDSLQFIVVVGTEGAGKASLIEHITDAKDSPGRASILVYRVLFPSPLKHERSLTNQFSQQFPKSPKSQAPPSSVKETFLISTPGFSDTSSHAGMSVYRYQIPPKPAFRFFRIIVRSENSS